MPPRAGRVACAVVHTDPPGVFIAEDDVEERWADAVVAWIEHTGTVIDAYPDEVVWSAEQLDPDRMSLEMRISPFQD
jgi:hypothetical protein